MSSILTFAAVSSILCAAAAVGAAGLALRETTLIAAWRWALAAIVMWLISVTWMGLSDEAGPTLQLLWFATALLSLCPAIAVLGARRPGAAAWTWFVLIPLLAVLGWPALTVWEAGAPSRPLWLETPQLIGFGLVLLMGAGNYAGTKFWASATLYAIAIGLLVATLLELSPAGRSPLAARAAACCALGLAAVLAHRKRPLNRPATTPLNRLWEDYHNTFGIVWTRRLQDRLNAVAQQKQWPVSVTPQGFHWNDEAPPELQAETTAKIEHSLRWMLRRFVSPEWIDRRLTQPANGESA